jgi:CHASE3 domain sensor protein
MTDLRPETLLALADELEEQHTFSAFWSAVDDAVATLRAIAAPSQPKAQQPMAGEPDQRQRVAELEQLLKVMERQYADALASQRAAEREAAQYAMAVGAAVQELHEARARAEASERRMARQYAEALKHQPAAMRETPCTKP